MVGSDARLITSDRDRVREESDRQILELKPIEEQARGLHSVLRALPLTSTYILVGHSFGGAMARIYGDMFPREVAGLVLVDPFHEDFAVWLRLNQPASYELLKQECLSKYLADWDGFLERLQKCRTPNRIPVTLLTAQARVQRQNDALEQKISRNDFAEGARAIEHAHEKWIRNIGHGKHVLVPDAGHEVPSEKPEFVVDAIKELLNTER